MGRHQEFGRTLGRRHHRGRVSEGVRRLSVMGSSRYRRDGIRRIGNAARGEGSDRRGRARHHRLPGIALALIVVAVACSRSPRAARVAQRPPQPVVNFTALDSPSLQFLPRQNEAPGWVLQTDPSVIPASQLASYLGDDAEPFLRYAVLDATIGKYAGATPSAFALVEIYRFPDFVKAFGAYSIRKTQIGRASCRER